MTNERKQLMDEFQKWLDTNPRKEIIAAQCATIAEEYAQRQVKNCVLVDVSNRRELLIAFKAYQEGRAKKPNQNDTHYVDSYLEWDKRNL